MTDSIVMRVDERLHSYTWPEISLSGPPELGPGDTLIMCSGFEERSTWALEQACASGSKSFRLIHIIYEPFQSENRIDVVKKLVENSGLHESVVAYDRLHPSGIASKVIDALPSGGTIFVDISGMSRLLIIQLLVALARTGCFGRSIVLYTEPVTYFPTETEFVSEHQCEVQIPISYISSGVYEVASTPELSSVAMQGESIRLIAFPSFNSDQLNTLVMEVLPTYLELIYCRSERSDNKWREDAIRFCNSQFMKGLSNTNEYIASSTDYREALRKILEIYASHYVFDRILVAPTGTKLQSIAVALIKIFLDDVQVVYPIPHEFKDPSRYTAGAKKLYRLSMSTFAEYLNNK